MQTPKADRRTDTASRLIEASPERIYAALIEKQALEVWLPPTGMSGRFEVFEPVVGGRFRMILTYDDAITAAAKSTDDADIVEARFIELVPNQRMAQSIDFESDDPAFAGTMTMTWDLTPERSGTLVAITATDVPVGIRPEDHQEGFAASLGNLAALLESESPSTGSSGEPSLTR